MKLEVGKESRQRQKTHHCEGSDVCNDGDSDKLMCLMEGKMGEDSSGMEYEPHNEDEGVNDSELSLESEFSVDEGSAVRIGGMGGRARYADRERHNGGQCRSRGGPSKCKVEARGERTEMQRPVVVMKGADVVLQSRCTIKKLVGVNARMTVRQRETVREPRWKAFRVGGRRVLFSMFDVALMTGLLTIGMIVELDGDEVTTVVEKWCMAAWQRRLGKKRRFFRNYMSTMAALCEENSEDDQVGLWVRIYAFMILSGVLFPRTPYEAACEDIEGMGQYNWAKAVWRVVVDTIEDTQRKLYSGPLTKDKKRYPRIASWARVDHGGRYDASELVKDIKEKEVIHILYPQDAELVHASMSQFMETAEFGYYVDDGWLSVDERLRRARDAYLVGKKAHKSTKNEVEMLREQLAALERQIQGCDNGVAVEVGQGNQGLSASKVAGFNEAPNLGRIVEEGRPRYKDGVDGAGDVDIDRNDTQGVSGESGDADNEGNAMINGQVQPEQHAECAGCTPKDRAAVDSGRPSNIVPRLKIKPREGLEQHHHDPRTGRAEQVEASDESAHMFSSEVRCTIPSEVHHVIGKYGDIIEYVVLAVTYVRHSV
ncbi:hypothetical protein Cgig2_019683 [Carnegiea gigantea]|uniref:Aminotransferase-like plant mobile domain-containing protein n=1 Tax=Carnegiea gigantea TaxID=171969 RepID=A0A9Q1QA92_9CARY|nr:hypothetical protein Cgig2_019683 [Carnegiea gigantea]